jgi:hypothetical protein
MRSACGWYGCELNSHRRYGTFRIERLRDEGHAASRPAATRRSGSEEHRMLGLVLTSALRPRRGAATGLRHFEASRRLSVAPEALFAHLDDQTRLAAHMTQSSAMMGGGRMTYAFDAERGMAVGSRVRMGGSAFGLTMSVEEEITERNPPVRKVWQTLGTPRLLIIGGYEMGFAIAPEAGGSKLRVWIDYILPHGWLGKLFGWLLAGFYARWCVGRMVSDAERAVAGAVCERGPSA